jgi:hypothetical protein
VGGPLPAGDAADSEGGGGVIAGLRQRKPRANVMGLHWHTVNAIMKAAVERGLERREREPIQYLGLDEKSFRRGHVYATMFNDLDNGRVWDLVEGRKEEQARELLQELDATQRAGVKAVAMAIWSAYRNAVEKLVQQADIVHDKFPPLRLSQQIVREGAQGRASAAGAGGPANAQGQQITLVAQLSRFTVAAFFPPTLPLKPSQQPSLAAERHLRGLLAVLLRRCRAEALRRLARASHSQRADADEESRRDVRPPSARFAQQCQTSYHQCDFRGNQLTDRAHHREGPRHLLF